ncbi:MAG: glycosyltransferase [Akkermansia sp.]|nr:glycosyltransferase [Akkermansia sp.]
MSEEMQDGYQLTIITVCRNAKERLMDTVSNVRSIKADTKLSIQHLLIDGASTDGTSDLLHQWHDAGVIEDFVSEPDSGIYDAMNKGIRLSKGQVLYFLNAGDLLLNAKDLEKCVEPLLSGVAEHAVAPVVTRFNEKETIDLPCFEYVYLRTPCCHQGYFATAALYRSLGGYDVATYRCIADADFMCKAFASVGYPFMWCNPVAAYPADGFSCNSVFHYLPEYIELTNRYWSLVLKLCKIDAEYRDLVMGVLTDRCLELSEWRKEKGGNVTEFSRILQHQMRDVSRGCGNLLRKFSLQWAARIYMDSVTKGRDVSTRCEKAMYWVRIACSMRPGNKYALQHGYPARSLREALVAKFRSLLPAPAKISNS